MSRWQFHQCNGGRLDDDLFENAVYQDAIGFVKDQLTSNQDRIASLDGWRAVSIGMVLAAHSTMTAGFPDALRPLFKWIADADLGVRCFFLISGLLITWLLLREKQTRGTINLRDFYLRRVIRILPVYYAFLLVIVVLTLTTPFNQAASSWVANLTFTTNFVQNGPWTTGHLWSLAVEEQFYLLWPGILVLSLAFNRKRQTKILIVILIGALALAPLSRAASYELRRLASENPLASPYSFFNYFDSIALGCGCAFVLFQKQIWLKKLRVYPACWIAAAVSLIAIPHILGRLFIGGKIVLPLGPSIQGIGLSVLVLQSIALSERMPYQLLNLSSIRFVGILSYSLYIWQMIFCTDPTAFGLTRAWWLSFPGWLASAFVIACLSYFGFEEPLLKLRRKFRHVPHMDEQVRSIREGLLQNGGAN